jgi:membrane protease YdiL (CAAX protease family)
MAGATAADAHWSLRPALAAALAQRALVLLAGGWLARQGDPSAPGPALFAAVAVGGLAGAGVVGLLLRAGGRTHAELGWSGWRPARDLELGLVGALAMLLATVLVAWAAFGDAAPRELALIAAGWAWPARALFLLIGLSAAYAEESIFRGWLQKAAVARYGRWLGIGGVAFLFALLHFSPPAGLAVKLLIGLVLGLLADWTGALWAPALAHAAYWLVLGMA